MMLTSQFCPVEEVSVIFKCFGREMRTIEWIKSFHPKCWICNSQHVENCCQLDDQIYHFFFKFHDLAHLVVNFVWGFGGSAYWVPFAIITRVLFVLVCHCQLMFWIIFFSCRDGNIGKKFYMSTSLRNLTKSIIFILFLGFVFQIMWALTCSIWWNILPRMFLAIHLSKLCLKNCLIAFYPIKLLDIWHNRQQNLG